jgi:hypothetical protein
MKAAVCENSKMKNEGHRHKVLGRVEIIITILELSNY